LHIIFFANAVARLPINDLNGVFHPPANDLMWLQSFGFRHPEHVQPNAMDEKNPFVRYFSRVDVNVPERN